MNVWRMLLVITATLAVGLSACGVKRDLKLPKDENQAQQNQPADQQNSTQSPATDGSASVIQ